MPMFSDAGTLPIHESPDTTPDELYGVAEDLMLRSKMAREQGDAKAAHRLLRAALDLMVENDIPTRRGKGLSPDTAMVGDLLKRDWQEPEQLSQATGLSAGSIRAILSHMKRRGVSLQVQHITRYRISD